MKAMKAMKEKKLDWSDLTAREQRVFKQFVQSKEVKRLSSLPVEDPESAARVIFDSVPDIMRADQEIAVTVFLDGSSRAVNCEVIHRGLKAKVYMDTRMVFERMFKYKRAVSLILAHNHLSGNLIPSHDDLNITKRFKQACELMNISFLDHLIFGRSAGGTPMVYSIEGNEKWRYGHEG